MLYSKHQDIVLRHLRCVFSMDVEHICMCINRKLLQIYTLTVYIVYIGTGDVYLNFSMYNVYEYVVCFM